MSKINQGIAPDCGVTKYIGSDFDRVITVSDNIDDIKSVAGIVDKVATVAGISSDISKVVTDAGHIDIVANNIDVIKAVPTLAKEVKDTYLDVQTQANLVTKDQKLVAADRAGTHTDMLATETAKNETIKAQTSVTASKNAVDKAKQDVSDLVVKVKEIVKDSLCSGGLFTPKTGAEYPTIKPENLQDITFAISFTNRNDKWTFTTGNLKGTTLISGDQLVYRNATKTWDVVFSPSLASELDTFLENIYPVGHILLTTNSVNPSTYLKMGTWEAIEGGASITTADVKNKIDTKPVPSGSDSIEVPLPKHTHTNTITWGPKNAEYSQHVHDAGSYRVLAFCRFTSMQVNQGTELGGMIYTHELEGEGFKSGNGFKYPDMYAIGYLKGDPLPVMTPLVTPTPQNKLPLSKDLRKIDEVKRVEMYQRSTTSRLILDATKDSGFTGNSGNPTSEHKHDFTVTSSTEGTEEKPVINVAGRNIKVFTWVRVA